MSDMKCPFCGEELDKQINLDEHYACLNTENCKFSFMVLPKKWWQALIDGKKAQDRLKSVKEYYVIVRGHGKEQHYISYSTGDDWFWNWDLDHAEPFDTIQDAKDQIRAAKIPHARVMKVCRLTEITSITKQEK
nr:MAG TPA: cysteine-rich protein [Caudoviricetes sp.]